MENPESFKERVIWRDMGRDTIDYAGRVEAIPTSVWLSEKDARMEIEKRLFDEQVFLEITNHFSLSSTLKEIIITHISCWMGYHVFCLEIETDGEECRVAMNLLPPAEKKPLFKEYWDRGCTAWKETGVIAHPILLSEDGRFFVQEWIEGEPVSSVRGSRWRELKNEIIVLICEAVARLNKIGLVFYPLLDYEIMYSGDKVVFLDITRLKEGGFDRADELFNLCRKSAINSTPIDVKEFCRGIARVYPLDDFTEFIGGWREAVEEIVDLEKFWKKEMERI